jgi:hypothetical protein
MTALDALQHYLFPLPSSHGSALIGPERSTMHNSKVAIICYAAAVGFILAVAFHSPAKLLMEADALAPATTSSSSK